VPPLSTQNTPELTTEEVQAIPCPAARFASVLLASGPRIFDTPGRPVRVPKLKAGVDPDWIGENEQITEKDAYFGEVTLLPDTMKSAKVISRFSNELARSSVVALDAALRARLVTDVAAKLDHAFFAGDGDAPAGTEPLGVLEFAGTQELPAVGAISIDDLHDAEGLALAAAVDPAKLTWFVRPETFTALRKLKDGAQRYQLTPDPTQAGVLTLLGHPVRITDRLSIDATPTPDVTSLVLADVKSYTRGVGFEDEPELPDDLAAVLISVTARSVLNPSSLAEESREIVGDYRRTRRWAGPPIAFTLVEQAVLARYRQRTA
jgi:capsid protein